MNKRYCVDCDYFTGNENTGCIGDGPCSGWNSWAYEKEETDYDGEYEGEEDTDE